MFTQKKALLHTEPSFPRLLVWFGALRLVLQCPIRTVNVYFYCSVEPSGRSAAHDAIGSCVYFHLEISTNSTLLWPSSTPLIPVHQAIVAHFQTPQRSEYGLPGSVYEVEHLDMNPSETGEVCVILLLTFVASRYDLPVKGCPMSRSSPDPFCPVGDSSHPRFLRL
ncbi:hypothetical protein F5888DRAFT_1639926 [Russula emetica]|nr:hypothetical protein F5888DRAFT_1639926 [Russula emetica]